MNKTTLTRLAISKAISKAIEELNDGKTDIDVKITETATLFVSAKVVEHEGAIVHAAGGSLPAYSFHTYNQLEGLEVDVINHDYKLQRISEIAEEAIGREVWYINAMAEVNESVC